MWSFHSCPLLILKQTSDAALIINHRAIQRYLQSLGKYSVIYINLWEIALFYFFEWWCILCMSCRSLCIQVVYIAPLKALVRERIEDWKVRIEEKLGKKWVGLYTLHEHSTWWQNSVLERSRHPLAAGAAHKTVACVYSCLLSAWWDSLVTDVPFHI